MPSEPLNIDGNDESADWTKRTWDIHGPVAYQADLVAGLESTPLAEQQRHVDEFMRLVAARAMPPAVRAELERRGLRLTPPRD